MSSLINVGLQPLESRQLLAGDVTATLVDGLLRIVGDGDDNGIALTLGTASTPTQFEVAGGTVDLDLSTLGDGLMGFAPASPVTTLPADVVGSDAVIDTTSGFTIDETPTAGGSGTGTVPLNGLVQVAGLAPLDFDVNALSGVGAGDTEFGAGVVLSLTGTTGAAAGLPIAAYVDPSTQTVSLVGNMLTVSGAELLLLQESADLYNAIVPGTAIQGAVIGTLSLSFDLTPIGGGGGPAGLTVEGLAVSGATTVNGAASEVFDPADIDSIYIKTKAGDDLVDVSALDLPGVELAINASHGVDAVNISASNLADLHVYSRSGANDITVTDTNVTGYTSFGLGHSGSALSVVNGSYDDLHIFAGAGNNDLSLVGSTVSGTTFAWFGHHASDMLIDEASLGHLVVLGSHGNDTLRIEDTTVHGCTYVNMYSGNDVIEIIRSDFLDVAFFSGGGGYDTFVSEDSTYVQGWLWRFEDVLVS